MSGRGEGSSRPGRSGRMTSGRRRPRYRPDFTPGGTVVLLGCETPWAEASGEPPGNPRYGAATLLEARADCPCCRGRDLQRERLQDLYVVCCRCFLGTYDDPDFWPPRNPTLARKARLVAEAARLTRRERRRIGAT